MRIKLTRKQKIIVEHIRENPADTDAEIAAALCNSRNTIVTHIKDIRNRFDVNSKRELIKKITS